MKKIPTIYERDRGLERITRKLGKPLTDTPNEDALWVFGGEGIATRKWDGTPVYWDGEKWYKRAGTTWTPMTDGPEDQWLCECVRLAEDDPSVHTNVVGSYEAVGPKINGNPDNMKFNTLRRHGDIQYEDVPTDLAALKAWLTEHDIEGIVWHHPDGRMAKVKKRDFGLSRK